MYSGLFEEEVRRITLQLGKKLRVLETRFTRGDSRTIDRSNYVLFLACLGEHDSRRIRRASSGLIAELRQTAW